MKRVVRNVVQQAMKGVVAGLVGLLGLVPGLADAVNIEEGKLVILLAGITMGAIEAGWELLKKKTGWKFL